MVGVSNHRVSVGSGSEGVAVVFGVRSVGTTVVSNSERVAVVSGVSNHRVTVGSGSGGPLCRPVVLVSRSICGYSSLTTQRRSRETNRRTDQKQ